MRIEQKMLPNVYICQEGQYNFTRSKQIGYEILSDFLIGNLDNSNNLSWRGNKGDMDIDIEEMLGFLFQHNNSNTTVST